jgi:hypothetical protein
VDLAGVDAPIKDNGNSCCPPSELFEWVPVKHLKN